MSALGTIDGPDARLKLRRTLNSQSEGDGWGQIRESDLREQWDGDTAELDRALRVLEDNGEIERVEIGDVVSIQPAEPPAIPTA